MKTKTLLFLLLLSLYGQAQLPIFKTFNWDTIPSIPENVLAEKLILKNTEQIEFIDIDDKLNEYLLIHIVELINSPEQVELNNKKFIPINDESELIEAKIRIISPNKEVFNFDESNILTSIDETSGVNHKYFALERMEPGSVIDYYYVLKKSPAYNGKREYIQNEFQILEYNFELYSPKRLDFLFKIYNDSATIVLDTTMHEINHWGVHLKNIAGLKKEDQSPYYTSLKQLVYKLDKNSSKNIRDISSFGNASSIIYSNLFSPLDKKDLKELTSFFKEIKLSKKASTTEKIIAIEDFVKDNINIVGNSNINYSKIETIVKLKSATETGIIRLLIKLYQLVDIDIQVVMTADRTTIIFDEDFESYHPLVDYLIYFPKTDKYIAPSLFEYRYGLIPWELTDNKGLFVKEISLGEFKTGIGKVRKIAPLTHEASYQNIDAKVTISNDFSSADIILTTEAMGYYATSTQPYYNLFNADYKKEFTQLFFAQFFPESKLTDGSVKYGEAKYVGKQPFIQTFRTNTDELIDIAGNKYLFKVGRLIGHQIELYSESTRILPIDTRYNRSFNRQLKINIPEGYICNNMDDLLYSEHYTEGKDTILFFESKYSMDGNTLIIDIKEFYNQIHFSVDKYEQYREVVNIAADFEKKTLLFEKKE
ncbi:MAG: hypothetical protein ACERKD_13490 [Prolixibacteraceae bacterium]